MSLMLRSYLSLCCNNVKKLPPFITLQCYKITSLYIYSSNHLWHISSLRSRLLHDLLKQTHAVENTDLKIQAKLREIHTGLNVLPKYSLLNHRHICRNPCILTLNLTKPFNIQITILYSILCKSIVLNRTLNRRKTKKIQNPKNINPKTIQNPKQYKTQNNTKT